ncbi:MAG TPA: peptidoglycan-binding domain-containing protein [Aromatoleum sp.]|uniref:peptidoglycan-binding domain-containing protein n=1 Tax=Aromatoleum sp. TaxID=2307007 RepID=UPI002B488D49|nr:peptidoglycan-binding domain-containing protein [Aromatoleum sp.]HJV27147.1 peptidoglycan-binding domain-containing protein [Aromatoleum sp.]
MKAQLPVIALAVAATFMGGCDQMPIKMGDAGAKTPATGAAGGGSAENASSQLERCDKPFGTAAVVEDQNSGWYRILTSRYQLTSTVPVLRLLMQQSNCFIVVERGRAMANMQQERALQQGGELRAGSNFGKGQMVSADYSVNPEILFSERGTGGLGAAAGAIGGGVVGAIVGNMKTNEASTMLTLVDNRSGVQVGVAEGSAKNTDFGLGGLIGGGGAAAGLGGYTNTPQGKVIAGAFMDSFNQMVRALRNYTAQSMGDRGLGTGGKLAVDGASQPGGYSGGTISMKDAQTKLNKLGFDAGTPDGKMGSKTTNALRQYQTDRNIPVTGRLDAATQAELLK